MNIDVGKAVQELLFEQDTVILPGLGGFMSTSISATVDYVQGSVQPPSKKLAFNANLHTNDGILVNHIQHKEVVTAKEANDAIDIYVTKVKDALEKREIVDIPKVGRLYKDYKEEIQFMPENTNFQIDSFGLPTVSFNPIARQKAGTQAQGTAGASTVPKRKPYNTYAQHKPHWAEKSLPWLIVFAAILLAFSLFMWLQDDDSGQQAAVPEDRINVKPSQEENEELSALENGTLSNDGEPSSENGADISQDEENNGITSEEKPSPPPPTVYNKFIVIHSFGVKKNADQFYNTLERGGYTATSKFHGGLHRVGVEIVTSDTTEINNLANELGRKFKSTPVAVDY